MRSAYSLKRMKPMIAEKDADIEHLNETNEEFRPSDEDEFNN